MADINAFDTLTTYLETSVEIDIDVFFATMRAQYGFSDILYLDAERVAGVFVAQDMQCTHPRHRAGPCFSVHGEVEDRALELALKSFRPLDYEFVRRHFENGAYLTVAVGADDRPLQGIALPLKSAPGRAAVLVLEATMQPADWRVFLHRHLRDLQFIASLFHSAQIDRRGAVAEMPVVALTPRERAVIDGSRAGKASVEIASSLGMAERVAQFFLDNALRKLAAAGEAGPDGRLPLAG